MASALAFSNAVHRISVQAEQTALRTRREGPFSPQGHEVPALPDFFKYTDRLTAADIAFCVAGYGRSIDAAAIEQALTDDYLSRNPSPSTRAAYIRQTMAKAREWAAR